MTPRGPRTDCAAGHQQFIVQVINVLPTLPGSLADSFRIVGLPLTLILITAACHIVSYY